MCMADSISGGESLGSARVDVTGNIQPLIDAFAEANKVAAEKGAEVGHAFDRARLDAMWAASDPGVEAARQKAVDDAFAASYKPPEGMFQEGTPLKPTWFERIKSSGALHEFDQSLRRFDEGLLRIVGRITRIFAVSGLVAGLAYKIGETIGNVLAPGAKAFADELERAKALSQDISTEFGQRLAKTGLFTPARIREIEAKRSTLETEKVEMESRLSDTSLGGMYYNKTYAQNRLNQIVGELNDMSDMANNANRSARNAARQRELDSRTFRGFSTPGAVEAYMRRANRGGGV